MAVDHLRSNRYLFAVRNPTYLLGGCDTFLQPVLVLFFHIKFNNSNSRCALYSFSCIAVGSQLSSNGCELSREAMVFIAMTYPSLFSKLCSHIYLVTVARSNRLIRGFSKFRREDKISQYKTLS